MFQIKKHLTNWLRPPDQPPNNHDQNEQLFRLGRPQRFLQEFLAVEGVGLMRLKWPCVNRPKKLFLNLKLG